MLPPNYDKLLILAAKAKIVPKRHFKGLKGVLNATCLFFATNFIFYPLSSPIGNGYSKESFRIVEPSSKKFFYPQITWVTRA